jgi:hypothetical protein
VNHEETKAAIRLSLLMGDTRSERHGCYANRRPLAAPLPLPEIPLLPVPPLHVYGLPVVRENQRPPL